MSLNNFNLVTQFQNKNISPKCCQIKGKKVRKVNKNCGKSTKILHLKKILEKKFEEV